VAAGGNDYRIYSLVPDSSSPVIDAAHGEVCTEKDFRGKDRYDDPEVANVYDCTGIPGCISFADIGAYEYVPSE
jgi:hypothetical protein